METGILPPELKSIEQLFTGDAQFAVPSISAALPGVRMK